MDSNLKEPTLEELAAEYVKTMYLPANGWGQHVHPRYGQSHNIMKLMWTRFGREASNKAIDAEFTKRRDKNLQYVL